MVLGFNLSWAPAGSLAPNRAQPNLDRLVPIWYSLSRFGRKLGPVWCELGSCRAIAAAQHRANFYLIYLLQIYLVFFKNQIYLFQLFWKLMFSTPACSTCCCQSPLCNVDLYQKGSIKESRNEQTVVEMPMTWHERIHAQLAEWTSGPMSRRINEPRNQSISESFSHRRDESMNQRLNKIISPCASASINKWSSEWSYEAMNR